MAGMIEFRTGTQDEYNSIQEAPENILYFITDTQRVYRGSHLVSSHDVEFVDELPPADYAREDLLYVVTDAKGVITISCFKDGNPVTAILPDKATYQHISEEFWRKASIKYERDEEDSYSADSILYVLTQEEGTRTRKLAVNRPVYEDVVLYDVPTYVTYNEVEGCGLAFEVSSPELGDVAYAVVPFGTEEGVYKLLPAATVTSYTSPTEFSITLNEGVLFTGDPSGSTTSQVPGLYSTTYRIVMGIYEELDDVDTNVKNKTTLLSDESTDSQYPSAKAVVDALKALKRQHDIDIAEALQEIREEDDCIYVTELPETGDPDAVYFLRNEETSLVTPYRFIDKVPVEVPWSMWQDLTSSSGIGYVCTKGNYHLLSDAPTEFYTMGNIDPSGLVSTLKYDCTVSAFFERKFLMEFSLDGSGPAMGPGYAYWICDEDGVPQSDTDNMLYHHAESAGKYSERSEAFITADTDPTGGSLVTFVEFLPVSSVTTNDEGKYIITASNGAIYTQSADPIATAPAVVFSSIGLISSGISPQGPCVFTFTGSDPENVRNIPTDLTEVNTWQEQYLADQSYSSSSTRPQSGIAVNEALSTVQSAYYGTCSNYSNAMTKVVTCPEFKSLKAGASIRVKFTHANIVPSPTLNVNSTGAKAIRTRGTVVSVDYRWQSGEVKEFVYDGDYWIMVDGGIADTSYYGVTKLTNTDSSSNRSLKNTAATPYFVSTLVSEKEDTGNKTQSLTDSSTSEQFPSAKAVYDFVQDNISVRFVSVLPEVGSPDCVYIVGNRLDQCYRCIVEESTILEISPDYRDGSGPSPLYVQAESWEDIGVDTDLYYGFDVTSADQLEVYDTVTAVNPDGSVAVSQWSSSIYYNSISIAPFTGTGAAEWVQLELPTGGGSITVDSELSDDSENPVQSKAIKSYIDTAIGTAILDAIGESY